MSITNEVKLFSGTNSKYLSEKIAEAFGKPLGDLSISKFSDGEFQPNFNESVRGCDIFLIQSTFPSSDNLVELLLMIDAAKEHRLTISQQ
jgi:ribose-phosphate pyrophosphokinase